jgi:hypothetical protein
MQFLSTSAALLIGDQYIEVHNVLLLLLLEVKLALFQ